MLDPIDLANSIYVGDRALKAVLIDGWRESVSFRISAISRLRPGTASWDFYSGGDIHDGSIVLTGVRSIRFEPAGPLPNDYINSLEVRRVEAPGPTAQSAPFYTLLMNVSSVAHDGTSSEVEIEVTCQGIHLEDPSRPGIEIRE